MKNQTNPLQKINKIIDTKMTLNNDVNRELYLQIKEFTDKTDLVGFFEEEYEPK